MSTDAYDKIFELQALDLEIDHTTRRVENNPLAAEVEKSQAELSSAQSELDQVAEQQKALSAEISRTTPKLVDMRLKRETLQAKIYDGSVTSQKELDSINSSIEFVNSELDELETKQLEEMESLDVLDESVSTAEARCSELSESLEKLNRNLDEDTELAKAELVELDQRRTEITAQCDSKLRDAYQSLRDNAVQKPFAKLIDRKCDGCNMAVAAVNIDRLKNATDNAVEHCDECGRVLVLQR